MNLPELRTQLPAFVNQKPVKEFEHNYFGFGVHKSRCRVKIWKSDELYFVLMIDMSIGTSVTNAAETIIETVYKKYFRGVDKGSIIWAETYENEPEESVDIVVPEWGQFSRVNRVTWKHLGVLLRGITK